MYPDAGKDIDCFTLGEKNARISQTLGIGSAGLLSPVEERQPQGMLLIGRPKGQGIQPGHGEALGLVRGGFETYCHHGRNLLVLL